MKKQTSLTDARDFVESVIQTVREPSLILDGELRVISVNRSFTRVFHVSREESEGKRIYDLAGGQWDLPELRKLFSNVQHKNAQISDYEVENGFSPIGPKTMVFNARRIGGTGKHTGLIFVAIGDVMDRDRAENPARQSRRMKAVGRLVSRVVHDLNNLLLVILVSTEDLSFHLVGNKRLSESVEEIESAAKQASLLTRRLLACRFPRVCEPEPRMKSDAARELPGGADARTRH